MNTSTTRVTITRANLPKVIAKAYDLSQPQGMGFLHAKAGGIPDEVLQQILDRSDNAKFDMNRDVRLDYVQGRAIKLGIGFDAEARTFYLEDRGSGWYDHSDEQWVELLTFAQAVGA